MDYKRFLEIVESLLIQEGKKLETVLKAEGRIDSSMEYHASLSTDDIVTKLDGEIENVLYSEISKNFPELGFNLEEAEHLNDDGKEFVCYIDPIDGTKYFARDIPLFATSVGLIRNGEPVAGLIYNPLTRQMYKGAEGVPTTLNNNPVRVSQVDRLEDAIISVDHSKIMTRWDLEKEWLHTKLIQFSEKTKRIRLFGQGALSCAWTAANGIDGFVSLWGHAEKPFDIAAGKALIKYAGGITRDVKVPQFEVPRVIGGNVKLVNEMMEILLS